MKDLPKYKAVLNDENQEQGVSFISLVESPATEEHWIAMTKQDNTINLSMNEDKRIITGAVLIPDQEIYRVLETGEEFTISYDAKCIEKVSIDFFKKMRGINNTTIEHNKHTPDITIYESWIKTTENDKSNDLLKKDYKLGTWFITMKIEDEQLWKNIKEGKQNGFSIEGIFDLQPIEDQIVKQSKENKLKKVSELSEIFKEFNKINTIYNK
jgi:uncharacterized protein YaiE (UPF0345 family)